MPEHSLLGGQSSTGTLAWENEATMHDKPDHLRSVEHFTGLRVTVMEGDGQATVMREVVHYFDEHGNRIAVNDPFPEGAPHG